MYKYFLEWSDKTKIQKDFVQVVEIFSSKL